MNGLARCFRSAGNGRNRISRVVLSTEYRNDESRMRPAAAQSAPVARIAARRAEADGQNQQGEPDAEMAVDAARQPDLNDQAGQRQVELHLAEERRDEVGAAGARGADS